MVRMRKNKLYLFVFFVVGIIGMTQSSSADVSDSVVKIFVASNKMDYYRPWQSLGITAASGSGVIIGQNRILTNAHVIADQTFIQVKKDSDPKKYIARVLTEGNDCDLALLTVDDPQFFKDIKPLEFGGLPKLQDAVTVIGYPQGGEKLSVTEGVVSRIEVTAYAQSSKQLLTVQIDAAINPGNSGGPVIQNGKLIGIAMQYLQSGQNIGYIIPMPIIDHFLADLKDGEYNGFPIIGIDFNITENRALRNYYQINKLDGGVLISRVLPFSPAEGFLKEGDVLLSIDQTPISEDGTFKFRGNERLILTHIITQKQIGENVRLKIMRDGKILEVNFPLKFFSNLVAPPQYFDKPPYYIYGGLVFTALTTDLLTSWGNRWWEAAPLDLNYYLIGTGRLNKGERKDLVVLLNVLPDDVNIGYHDYDNEVVSKVNGHEIKSFYDFVMILHQVEHSEPYAVIETEHNLKIILNNKDLDQINQAILKRNNIPAQYSQDVATWLKATNF